MPPPFYRALVTCLFPRSRFVLSVFFRLGAEFGLIPGRPTIDSDPAATVTNQRLAILLCSEPLGQLRVLIQISPQSAMDGARAAQRDTEQIERR